MTIHLKDGTRIEGVARIIPVVGVDSLICLNTQARQIIPFPTLEEIDSIVE